MYEDNIVSGTHDHPIAFFHVMLPPQVYRGPISLSLTATFFTSFPRFLSLSLGFPGNRWKTTKRSTPMTSASNGGHQFAAEEYMVNQSEKRPISSVLVIIAMQAEALGLANKFQLSEEVISVFRKGVPWVRYRGTYKDLHLDLVWPGKDRALGVDSVGTVSASLLTYASIQALQPDLIINAGTAGGFKAKGACIADVYLASDCAFHDRRIPIPVFDLYGVGLRQALSTPNLIKDLKLKVGKLSTGDSLDMCSQDEESIVANDATIKDMEGAAVAYVADLFEIPVIFMKAVTDIVDGEKPTAEEFLENLVIVAAALEEAVTQVIDYISGKCISDL